jgi:protein-tyrosine phosphatase
MHIDDFSSVILDGLIRFGAYPSDPIMLLALFDAGFTSFVDLTNAADHALLKQHGVSLYHLHHSSYRFLKEPIVDRLPATRAQARKILDWIQEELHLNHNVYIHCRDGHNACAVIAALVIIEEWHVSGRKALTMVRKAHQRRHVMKSKDRKLGAPQTANQKAFVRSWEVPFSLND